MLEMLDLVNVLWKTVPQIKMNSSLKKFRECSWKLCTASFDKYFVILKQKLRVGHRL